MVDVTDYENLARIAREACVFARSQILNKRAELGGDIRAFVQTKSSAVDPVTVVDTFAEEVISAFLFERRPQDGMIGEEGSATISQTEVTWIVDPIDGTVNFLYGLPQYAVSIGAAVNGEVVAGAVINVATGELFSAARGHGAFAELDGETRPLQCNHPDSVSQALLATGFGYAASRRQKQAEMVAKLLPRVRDIRRLGSAALDLCMVASGEVDMHLEHGLNAWDYAAGSLIAEEAGAITRLPSLSTPGDSGELLVAVAASIAEEFFELLNEIGANDSIPR